MLKSSFSSTNLELSKKDSQKKLKISKNIFDSAKSNTTKLWNNKDIQQYADPHESPLLKMEIELPTCKYENTSEEGFAAMTQQFESIYGSQD